MGKSSKKRKSRSSSSSRSPSPTTRRPRREKSPQKKKEVKVSKGRTSSKDESSKSKKAVVSSSPKKQGTRTSPRRRSSAAAEPEISEATRGSPAIEISKPSSSLSTFRIPKIKSCDKSTDAKTEELLSKNDSSKKQNKIKTDMRPRVLLGRGSGSSASSSSSKSSVHKNILDKDNKIVARDTSIPLKIERLARTDNPKHDTLSRELIKAKRRIKSLSDIPALHPTSLSDPKTLTQKIESPGLIEHNSLAEPSTKTFPDLPDYVESDEEEGMEWENLVPQILKLVKEAPIQYVENQANTEDHGEEMEVDPDPAEQLVIVPDTNIWIGNLNLIKRLLEDSFKPRIIIPWMVLQELDVGLHKTNLDKDKARQPVNFIYSLLSSKHPRVTGQRASEAAISKLKFDEIMADDSILNCVFQMQKNNNIVIFLTNDRNLLNKALVNGVIACDSQSVLPKIREIISGSSTGTLNPNPPLPVFTSDVTSLGQNLKTDRKRKPDSSNDFRPLPGGNKTMSPIISMELDANDDPMTGCCKEGPPSAKIPGYGHEVPSSSETESVEILEAIRQAFSYIIRWQMVNDYGMGGWEFALKIKPPWNLKTAIKCMLTHWIANFSFVFSQKGKYHLELLASLVEEYKFTNHADQRDLENSIVETALALFNLTDKSVINETPVLNCRETLMGYAISNRT